jgi:hypothetical protein
MYDGNNGNDGFDMTEKNQSRIRAAFDELHEQQLEIIARIAGVATGLRKEEQADIRKHIKDITERGSQELLVLAGELKILGRDNHPPQSVLGRNLSDLPAIKDEGIAVASAVNQELSSFLAEISEGHKPDVIDISSSRLFGKWSIKSR